MICHAERSGCFAQRNSHGVEGSLLPRPIIDEEGHSLNEGRREFTHKPILILSDRDFSASRIDSRGESIRCAQDDSLAAHPY